MRERNHLLLKAVLILALSGSAVSCASSMRTVESTGESRADKDGSIGSPGARGEGVNVTPPPPPSLSTQLSGTVEQRKLSSGTSICATERRDLRKFHVSLELNEEASPEVLLLLKQWLLESWQSEQISISRQECPSALFCVEIAPDSIQSSLNELGKVLEQPPHQAFFAQMAATERIAEEWSATLPSWSLSTAAHFLLDRESSAQLRPVEENEKAWATFVEKNSGASQLKRLSISRMRDEAERLISSAQVIIAGPLSAPDSIALIEKGSTSLPSNRLTTSVKPNREKDITEASNSPTYPEVFRISREGDSSYGMIAWRPSPASATELEVALRVMVARWKTKNPRGVQAQVRSKGGIESWPIVLLQGSYDAVETALIDLRAEQDMFLSATASPTASELSQARAVSQSNQTLGIEPRCLIRDVIAPLTSEGEDASRISLREAFGPISLIWGTPEAAVQSE